MNTTINNMNRCAFGIILLIICSACGYSSPVEKLPISTTQTLTRMAPVKMMAVTTQTTNPGIPTTPTITKINLFEQLPLGQYLVNLEEVTITQKKHNMLILYSTDGKRIGEWMDIGGGYSAFPSANLKYLAYNDGGKLVIVELSSGEKRIINPADCPVLNPADRPINNLIYSWSNNDEEMVVDCGKISIINLPNNSVTASFSSPIKITPEYPDQHIVNAVQFPKWSPNGKWIAFLVLKDDYVQDMASRQHGPYIVEVNCVKNPDCDNEPTLIADYTKEAYGTIMEWTSDNKLAVVPGIDEEKIFIYDVEKKQLLQTITLPEEVQWSIDGFKISPDGKWVAIDNNSLYLYALDGSYFERIIKLSIESFFWIEKK